MFGTRAQGALLLCLMLGALGLTAYAMRQPSRPTAQSWSECEVSSQGDQPAIVFRWKSQAPGSLALLHIVICNPETAEEIIFARPNMGDLWGYALVARISEADGELRVPLNANELAAPARVGWCVRGRVVSSVTIDVREAGKPDSGRDGAFGNRFEFRTLSGKDLREGEVLWFSPDMAEQRIVPTATKPAFVSGHNAVAACAEPEHFASDFRLIR